MQLRRHLLQEAGGAIGVSLLSVGVWLASDPSGSFWPGWVIGVSLLPFVRDAWRLLGPGSNLDVVEAQAAGAPRTPALARGRRHRQYRGLPRAVTRRARERPGRARRRARARRAVPSATARRRASRASWRVRERVALLLDAGSFAEEALLANWMQDGLGADGVVTGRRGRSTDGRWR